MARLTAKQQKAEAKMRARANRNANQGGVVPYGQHQKATWRKSTNDQAVSYPRFTPQQQQLLNNILPYLQGGMQNLALPGNDRLSFEPIRQNALNDFDQKIVPSIAERFQSLGGPDASGGALSSPALYQQLLGGANNLQGQLAALESQYGLQKNDAESRNLFNLLGAGLGSQFDIGTVTGQNSGIRNAWNQVKGAIPGVIAGGITGGTAGAAYGGLSGLGFDQISSALQQRQQNSYDPMQDFGTGNLAQNYQNASQQRYQNIMNPSGGANTSGFTAQNNPSGFNLQNSQSPSFSETQRMIQAILGGYQNN